MYVRALAVWLGILVLASINGAVRDLGLAPALGDTLARAISTVVLCMLILLTTWAAIGWISPRSGGEALRIGSLWVLLTLAFEFLFGHFVSHQPWAALLADYDVTHGRIWILALVVTFGAPLWTARRRGLVAT